MSLRENRNATARLIQEGRFVASVLERQGREIDADIEKKMSGAGFKSSFWHDKRFSIVAGGTLEYRHKKQHRFVDMRTRNTKNGTIRKKSHAIHNRIIYGHLNDIAHQLAFGFTDEIVAQMRDIQ